MAALVPVEYVAYICLWCCTKLRECVFLYQTLPLIQPIPIAPTSSHMCPHTVFHSAHSECAHLEHFEAHRRSHTFISTLPTHTPLHTPYAVHTERSPSLDFIRDFFIMAARCAHKSQVPRRSKKIHNKVIKGEAARKERKRQASSDEGNNSCTVSERRD